jgi:hypothetical protein
VRALLAVALAVALSYLFWRPLWHGGGLVGGDLYSYFLPQKAFYADELHSGRIPLWNPLVGHGYPLVAESQTGVFYPLNLLLYSWLDVNTAYNVQQLAHYVLAFLATWLYARRLGLHAAAAALTALVFVYGWFAPRICLEWAILGGVYLPLLAWCAESFLITRRRHYLALLAIALAMHLLAGHFNLAFIEVLAVATYCGLRVWLANGSAPLSCARREFSTSSSIAGEGPGVRDTAGQPTATFSPALSPDSLPAVSSAVRGGEGDGAQWTSGSEPGMNRAYCLISIVISLLLGFGLAAIQLAPTWELKERSQRAEVGGRHDPGYGHIPPWYLVQVVTPWMWYAPDVDADLALQTPRRLTYPAATNKVEAHLYFGLLPLFMALGGLVLRWRTRMGIPQPFVIWLTLGLVAMVYATGWLLPVTRHLPGFSFFMGPGRYGIITTLAVALLAGLTLDDWLRSVRSKSVRALIIVAVLGVTLYDLWTVRIGWNHTAEGAPNWYADLVSDPPIDHRHESEVRRVLAGYDGVPRMFAPFQNLPTLTGFAMTPVYLGLGPAAYFDPSLTFPKPAHKHPTAEETAAQVVWLQRAGVTHILAESPLDLTRWPATLVWEGFDPLLHRAWARHEPLYLYELHGSRGRVSLQNENVGTIRVKEYKPSRVVVDVETSNPAAVVLTDLDWPGWTLTINGAAAAGERVDGMYRGAHVKTGQSQLVWTYAPASLKVGAAISAATLVLMGLFAVWSLRRSAVSGEATRPSGTAR